MHSHPLFDLHSDVEMLMELRLSSSSTLAAGFCPPVRVQALSVTYWDDPLAYWEQLHAMEQDTFDLLACIWFGNSELRYKDLHCKREAKWLEDNFTLIEDFSGLPANSSWNSSCWLTGFEKFSRIVVNIFYGTWLWDP